MELIQNYINGEHVPASSNERVDLHDPATGQVYGHLMDSNIDDVDHAVRSARNAFPIWSALTLHERADYLIAIAEEVSSRLDEFSKFESFGKKQGGGTL